MKLKNIGSTIISVGKTAILPDESKEIKDVGYTKNAAVTFLIKNGCLELVKERNTTGDGKAYSSNTNKNSDEAASDEAENTVESTQ